MTSTEPPRPGSGADSGTEHPDAGPDTTPASGAGLTTPDPQPAHDAQSAGESDGEPADPPVDPPADQSGREAMTLTEIVAAGQAATRTQNLAALDRIDAAFALLGDAEATCAAEAAAAIAAGRPPRPGHEHLEPWRITRSRITTTLRTSAYTAGRLLDAAIQLHTRTHRLADAAREAILDEDTLITLACRLRDVPDDILDAVEADLVPAVCARARGGDRPSRDWISGRTDRAIEKADPDELDRQAHTAHEQRRVTFRPTGSGMTTMWASLATEDAARLRARLRELAGQDHPGDHRTRDQRHADALASLADTCTPRATTDTDTDTDSGGGDGGGDGDTGVDDGAGEGTAAEDAASDPDANDTTVDDRADTDQAVTGEEVADQAVTGEEVADTDSADTSPEDGARHAAADSDTDAGAACTTCGCAGHTPPAPLQITVIAAAAQGLPERVEFVRGAYSSYDWLCAQVLAEENGGARFTMLDPLPGAQDDPDAALKYFISAAMARRIRLRDGTCRHPGCQVPAENCQIDHVIAFNHDRPELGGPTAEWNLICLCQAHHREKTFGPWTYRPGALGELHITTETGHQYRTLPRGMLALARDDLADTAEHQLTNPPPPPLGPLHLIDTTGHLTNPPGNKRHQHPQPATP